MSRAEQTTSSSNRASRSSAKRRSSEITRREILDAAEFLLSSRPFRELSVGAIMRRTEVGRSVFYSHFSDIFGVVEELLAGIRDEEVSYLERWDGTTDPVASLSEMITSTVSLWTRRGPMISSMLDAAASDAHVAALFDEITGHYCQVVENTLRRSANHTMSLPIDFAEASALIIHGTQAYLKVRLGAPGKGDPLIVAATLQRIWAAALYGAEPR